MHLTLCYLNVAASIHCAVLKSTACMSAGKTGQAEAIQLGIARAMVKLAPDSHRLLKAHGLLTRDPRVVECKKPAQKKARKKRAWVKR